MNVWKQSASHSSIHKFWSPTCKKKLKWGFGPNCREQEPKHTQHLSPEINSCSNSLSRKGTSWTECPTNSLILVLPKHRVHWCWAHNGRLTIWLLDSGVLWWQQVPSVVFYFKMCAILSFYFNSKKTVTECVLDWWTQFHPSCWQLFLRKTMFIEPELLGIWLSPCQHHDKASLPSLVMLSMVSSTLQDKLVLYVWWPLRSLKESLKMYQFSSDEAVDRHLGWEGLFQYGHPQGGNMTTKCRGIESGILSPFSA